MGLLPIETVAEKIGLVSEDLTFYGKYKAKVNHRLLEKLKNRNDGKLILVTAMTPTPAGEGKTTTSIGLGEAFWRLGKKAITCIRQPSMGPVFGIKGGATGGGCSAAEPSEEINLHLTGDIHAITAANNLLAAMIDNHIYHGNQLGIDLKRVVWKRSMDMNDRALREIRLSPWGKLAEKTYMTGFDITAASEVMAILSIAQSIADLKGRLGKIIIGYNKKGLPVRAKDLKVHGSMAALLSEAINPNLVQSTENTPVFVHGGPFANIAHGCSSLLATRLALKLSDYVITEAGFGSDLGAEKFFHIKCRLGGLKPSAAVIVATIRALKFHGGLPLERLGEENEEALLKGLANLDAHINNVRQFGMPAVVAINRFHRDTDRECRLVEKHVRKNGMAAETLEVFEKCGPGGVKLAGRLIELAKRRAEIKFLYEKEDTIKNKIHAIATGVYGAESVRSAGKAAKEIRNLERLGYGRLPVCIAKTEFSLSDDPAKHGRPKGFKVTVTGAKVSAGAGFVVVYLGNIMTMPGLPSLPAAERIDVDSHGKVIGI